MKLFQKTKHQPLGGSAGTIATTTTALSVQSIGENSEMAQVDDASAQTNKTKRLNKHHKGGVLEKMKILREQHNNKLDNNIAEARQRAAKRLIPPPFSPSNIERLNELKEAKLKAEERGGDGGSARSVVSSTSTVVSNFNILGEEQSSSVERDGVLFLTTLFLHMILFPFRKHSAIALIIVPLQSISLWALLNSVLVYAFDSIDFGQKELVKNMDYGKKLFVKEVKKYSMLVSGGVAAVSYVSAVGGKIIHGCANLLCSFLGESHGHEMRMCDLGAGAGESWAIRAFETSSFITSRLGVFVLAFLMMGHVLLPKPKKYHSENEGETSASKDNRRRQGHKNKRPSFKATATSFLLAIIGMSATVSATTSSQSILVAGSLNADTFLPIDRFPSPGENLTLLPNCHPLVDVPGGKGCNQAIACAKLSTNGRQQQSIDEQAENGVFFLGQFGNDAASKILQDALVNNNVDISSCGYSKEFPSGRGYVMIVPESGEVSAVVSGGSNLYGWTHWGVSNNNDDSGNGNDNVQEDILSDENMQDLVASHSLLLIQCEVPQLVNLRLAKAARKMNIPVIVDVGGEDRKMERELLECCDYLVPNETELERLAKSYQDDHDDNGHEHHGMTQEEMEEIQAQIGPSLRLPSIVKSVQTLQRNGASNVLVTLGSRGSILMKKRATAFMPRPSVIYQPPCPLPSGSTVVDETGAGDCYRAGFAVALLEHCGGAADGDVDSETLRQCMKFASAAGVLAVTKQGAVPSIPSRREVEELLTRAGSLKDATEGTESATTLEAVPRGGSRNDDDDGFPFLFGSRINSMKDRLDVLDPSSLPMATPRDYLQRQATIRGLGCVDFNYPQHFGDYWTPQEAKEALDEVNLVAGAVCLRYPSKFARGAMIHPDPEMRREAIEITKQAAEAARILGCNEVVVWSAYDGYDYPFQVSYQEKWDQIVEAFKECCDAYPDIKWSLEFKPTDENTRFFTVPSTGAAMLLVKEIDRPNMGLTLDMGHMLMAGENPGQSLSMVGEKLFGIQLNDGYTRLAAEDGMMFGSIHPSIALETIYQLRQINFSGHMYFDTFPQRTDPVKEAEYNIRRVKEFWRAVMQMDNDEVERVAREHDAIGALELVNEALRR